MEIYALYGPSGTGKSTSALALAHKYNINAIIDDGLLIYQGKKVAGQSAKYEKTTVQAVKRAIFFWEEHADAVKEAINHYPIERLLVLGTSRKMIHRIQGALALPEIHHYINIEEIRSSAEIKAALFDRGTQGRHVIPIPRIQVEQDFIHRLIAKVDKIFSPKKEEIGETTIVHPQFQTGKIHVSELAMKKIAIQSCEHLPFIESFRKVKVDITNTPVVEVDASFIIHLGQNVNDLANTIQQHIYDAFLEFMDLEVEQIRIVVSHIQIESPAHA
ncbi:AAA family ATPase [Ammoniphilus sp. CFH 90114]|uniref:AAA family ATPase n=1 Tax=Ammoniphilus sp. CFH 90114 TaxID=2493665 RepID=UPI00100ED28E|nr:AAA family ATPase [Ammoniphilus sp. CFH 90114]RXT05704.1 hypothetical protein EIZ39_16475 [Ammoniphilus sp. CFH 90114]